jgi:hypothetical protein
MPRVAVGAVPSSVYRIVAPVSAVIDTSDAAVNEVDPGVATGAAGAIRSTVL